MALALAAPHPVGPDELATHIFGDDGGTRRGDVRILVSRLRRQLRSESDTAGVRHDAGGYLLVGVTTDVAAFDRLTLKATAAEGRGEIEVAGGFARAALDLWPDVVEAAPFLDHPRSIQLLEQRLRVLQLWLHAEVRTGHHERVLPELLLACRAHPYAEELWRLGMVALYRAGRQVDALALYREVRGTLIGELGVEPGVNLRNAEWLILSHQLDAEESGPADRSQVLSLPGLPTYRDRYVSDGRCADALGRALRTAGPVSVTGTGGIGKTRLVVETLAMLREEWTRDAGFCSLSHVRDADGVAGAVAAALGVRIPPRSDPVRAIAHDLAKGRCVLVLDTCEHVADAVVTLIGELCRRCPALTVVATSRVPLKMDDGAVVEVTTLEPATAGVALFVDRAGRAEPDRAMADTELATIEALCARLDGLPLAIELAAARSRTFSPHELLDRLDRRLALLHDPLGRSDDRHASLRSTFQWSYDALQPVEQHVFRILGAFAAPTDLQAVEEVAFTPGDPAAGLAGLVEQSLVVARRRAGRTQFTQLDSLRAYAAELLEQAGEFDTARQRHTRYLAGRKDELVALCEGAAEGEASRAVDELWPDLRVALQWAVVNRRPGDAFALVNGLGSHAMLREKPEVGDWAAAACALAEDENCPGLPGVLAAAAMVDWIVGDVPGGIARATRCRHLAESAGPPSTDVLVAAMLNGGNRDPQNFSALCLGIADDARRVGNDFAHGWALTGAAMGHAYQGRVADALVVVAQARRIADRVGAPSLLALCEMARTIALLDDDPAAALIACDEALDLARTAGSTWFLGALPNYRAAALVRAGSVEDALDEVLTALRRLDVGGTPQSVANAVRNSVALLDRLGDPAGCVRLVQWLDTHVGGIIGTPGMRESVTQLRDRLSIAGPGEVVLADDDHPSAWSHQQVARRASQLLEVATTIPRR